MRKCTILLNSDLECLAKKLKTADDDQNANAAVAVILSREDDDFSVLLVKRVDNLGDPWSGQIGLPGGKRETKDENLHQCVVRETLEETGIDLARGRLLGLLPALRSIPRPDLMIVPFAVFFEHEPAVILNHKELESFVWIPLEQIAESRSIVKIGVRETPAFVVGETVIWGLTFRIPESYIEIIKNLST